MKKLNAFLCLIAIVSLPLACEGENNTLQPEKKYLLSECLVILNLGWKENTNLDEKIAITDEVSEIMKRVLVAGKLPLFSNHTTNSRDYFVFYFADKCENRKYFVEEIITEYIESEIKEFPEYHLQDEDIKVGFDGVTPSGWWKDH